MNKKTQDSIDKKIAEMTDDNHYQWFSKFQSAGNNNRAEVATYYIDELDKKFEQAGKLQAVFEEIYQGTTLEWPEDSYRKQKEFKFGWRTKDCEKKEITRETYIQRNIFLNANLYENELGHIFGYEVTFVRRKRFMPVDLISYKFEDGKLCFYLIELKACQAEKIKPAPDLLLRTLFEIATYKAYFKKVLNKNNELAMALQKAIKKNEVILQDSEKVKQIENLDEIKNADVKLIVLAPDYIINEKINIYKDNQYMKDFLKSDIEFFSITPVKQFDDTTRVGSKEKLFDIKQIF